MSQPSDPQALTRAAELRERIIGWRRRLHTQPELSGVETETAGFVAAVLRDTAFVVREQYGGVPGLVGDLPGGARPAVALRADLDALPIQEETGVEFASRRPGIMHACGHDAHAAMLLGAAFILSDLREQLPRAVRLIFQPHEERSPGGARPMIEAGVLDGVGWCFGLHVWSLLPVGVLGTRAWAFMSSDDHMRITVHGRGGHAAMPEDCVDPVLVAAEIVVALQAVASRGTGLAGGAVLSVTTLSAGTAHNVIPETASLGGTIRTLHPQARTLARQRVRKIAAGVAAAHGARVTVEITAGYPVLKNSPDAVQHVWASARRLSWTDERLVDLPPQGGAEDFAYYAERVPAAFALLGARDEEHPYPHHHPRFHLHEDALPLGAALLAQVALDSGTLSPLS